jgi:hypothetical protein
VLAGFTFGVSQCASDQERSTSTRSTPPNNQKTKTIIIVGSDSIAASAVREVDSQPCVLVINGVEL